MADGDRTRRDAVTARRVHQFTTTTIKHKNGDREVVEPGRYAILFLPRTVQLGVPSRYRAGPIRVCNPTRSLARSRNILAGDVGVEPTRTRLEPVVLP